MTIRNITNNPWFISGLSATAFLYLIFSVAMPLMSDDSALAASSSDSLPPADLFGTNLPVPTASGQEIRGRHAIGNRKDIQWLDDITRDPFKKMATKTVNQPKQQRRPTKTKLPKLTALFVSNNVEAAVLNQQLVNVGDHVNGFTVTKIEPRALQLQRNKKIYWLEPGDE